MFTVSNAFTKCIRLIDMNLRCQKSLLKSFYNLLYSKRLHSTCSYVSTITYLFWSKPFFSIMNHYIRVALWQQQFSKHLFISVFESQTFHRMTCFWYWEVFLPNRSGIDRNLVLNRRVCAFNIQTEIQSKLIENFAVFGFSFEETCLILSFSLSCFHSLWAWP